MTLTDQNPKSSFLVQQQQQVFQDSEEKPLTFDTYVSTKTNFLFLGKVHRAVFVHTADSKHLQYSFQPTLTG